jgi:hypothetical protein
MITSGPATFPDFVMQLGIAPYGNAKIMSEPAGYEIDPVRSHMKLTSLGVT